MIVRQYDKVILNEFGHLVKEKTPTKTSGDNGCFDITNTWNGRLLRTRILDFERLFDVILTGAINLRASHVDKLHGLP